LNGRIRRVLPGFVSTPLGTAQHALDLTAAPALGVFVAGSQQNFQLVLRNVESSLVRARSLSE
jgi:hypothetical protein